MSIDPISFMVEVDYGFAERVGTCSFISWHKQRSWRREFRSKDIWHLCEMEAYKRNTGTQQQMFLSRLWMELDQGSELTM